MSQRVKAVILLAGMAYDAIVQAGEPFKALEITGLRWVEIDTLDCYELAQRLFSDIDA